MSYKQQIPKVKMPVMFPKRKKEKEKESPPKRCTNCRDFWDCMVDLFNGPCDKYKRDEQIEPWRLAKRGE